MAVKIRLKRMGSKKKPFYRIVATDSRNPRDGRFIETLGYYNPRTDPVQIKVDEEGILKWLERGAVPSDSTQSILKQVGLMQKWQLIKQGVKEEDLEAKLEAMGVKTAPQPAPPQKKEPAKAVEKPSEKTEAEEASGAKETKELSESSEAKVAEKAEAEAPAPEASEAEPAGEASDTGEEKGGA